jgi:ABC-type phosphate/phosphonate transport system substrate-binding protein
MYAVAPEAAAAWRRLLERAIAKAGVAMDVIDHPAPAGLPELWKRPDLGCVFMCGWPFALDAERRPIVAAPIPAASWSAGRPIYRAEFVVAAGSPHRTLDDVLGRRFAFNAHHSHSGWNLPCAHLAELGAPQFRALVGPFVTHHRSIAAVADGEADVASVDSWWLELLRLHDPALASRVRVIASTRASPIPLLVGAEPRHGDPLGAVARDKLRAALLALQDEPVGRSLLTPLALRGFAIVQPEDYDITVTTERAAERLVASH